MRKRVTQLINQNYHYNDDSEPVCFLGGQGKWVEMPTSSLALIDGNDQPAEAWDSSSKLLGRGNFRLVSSSVDSDFEWLTDFSRERVRNMGNGGLIVKN